MNLITMKKDFNNINELKNKKKIHKHNDVEYEGHYLNDICYDEKSDLG